jgi:hypothetical protein
MLQFIYFFHLHSTDLFATFLFFLEYAYPNDDTPYMCMNINGKIGMHGWNLVFATSSTTWVLEHV